MSAIERHQTASGYLRTGAAAEYLGISRRHLHTLSQRGRIPYIKLGPRLTIYRKAEIDQVMDKLTVGRKASTR